MQSQRATALVALSIFCSLTGRATSAGAATFQPSTGVVSLTPDATAFGFESDAELAQFSPIKRADLYTLKAAPLDAVVAEGEGIEGKNALRVGNAGGGLLFKDESAFAKLAGRRMLVRFWAKAEGRAPTAEIVYRPTGKDPPLDGTTIPVASVRAIPTGRETSDGWVEYGIGPIDAQVLGRPIYGLFIVPEARAMEETKFAAEASERGGFLLDALEILPAEGTPQADAVCTDADVDATCGPVGACFAGKCVAGEALYGTPLSLAQRKEVVARALFVLEKHQGDASAVARLPAYKAALDALVNETSSRRFYAGMIAALHTLRNMHTSSGRFPGATSLNPDVTYQTAGAPGACFGLVTRDVLGGGTGFAVFDTEKTSDLRRGDVLKTIDGQEAVAWVRAAFSKYSISTPGQTETDDAWAALAIGDLVTAHAATFTVDRCTDATCATHAEVTVKTGDRARAAAQSGAFANFVYTIPCDGRLSRIGELGSGPPDAELFSSLPKDASGTVRVQFDGFSNPGFPADAEKAFPVDTPKYLVDARLGHGGKTVNMNAMVNMLIPKGTKPILMLLDRGNLAAVDDATLGCVGKEGFACLFSGADVVTADGTGVASRTSAKMAWLNGASVSANDIVPFVLEGRANTRIFSAVQTAGAFGGISFVGSVVPGRTMDSIQYEDGRAGADVASARVGSTVSGRGVAADVVVTQKLSDLLQGKDTAILAAQAWLAQVP
jgi:hypothetical protein